MTATCVYINVKPDKIEDFIRISIENHNSSIKEPGNLRFDVVQDSQNPSKFMLYEAYESEETAALHKTTAHYQKWRDAVQDWMAEPRYGVKYKILAY